MDAEKSIEYLSSVDWRKTRFGLYRTQALLDALGNPERELHFVHIAGTNGKGSTAAMTASMLREAGYRTGLYTSPFIQRFNERIQVDGVMIPDEDIIRITALITPIADSMADDHPTEFEMITAMGLKYFCEQGCDIVVLEVGMGGELDSTNVIPSCDVAAITAIGLDHTEYLGSSTAEIADTKAGIVKRGCSCVVYEQEQGVMDAVRRRCEAAGAHYHPVDFSLLEPQEHSLDGQVFGYAGMRDLRIPLLGEHQLKNAAVALEILNELNRGRFCIPNDAIKRGLEKTVWPARFEIVSRRPLFIIDGGHNPQCAQALAKNIADYLPGRRITFLVGVLADKDFDNMFPLILPYAERFITATPDSPRAMSAEALADSLSQYGLPVTACGSTGEAVDKAIEFAGEDGVVIAFGSLYMAGAIRDRFSPL